MQKTDENMNKVQPTIVVTPVVKLPCDKKERRSLLL